VVDSLLANNSAAQDAGGAISGSSCDFLLDRARFHRNAALVGGAVYCAECSLEQLERSRFERNRACGGGALSLRGALRFKIASSEFVANEAASHGETLSCACCSLHLTTYSTS
jgi:predicted outer membrane repeat protein